MTPMTPKTQSVCKQVNSKYGVCGLPENDSIHHNDIYEYFHTFEPVAEPASTGEPQSCPCPCHKGESVICNCGGGFECEYINSIPAARPSEPSAQYDALLSEAVKHNGHPPDIGRLALDCYKAGEAEYGKHAPCGVCHHAKHNGKCLEKLSHDVGIQCPCVMGSGNAPKVEDIARKLHLYHCQERRSGSICPCHAVADGMTEGCHCKEETADIAAILRPFPPASQTPQSLDFHTWLTRVHGFKVGSARNSYKESDLEAAWNAGISHRPEVIGAKPLCLDCHGAGIINCSHFDNCGGKWVYVATPASTARTEVLETAAELLGEMYDKWENGDPAFSESDDSLGNACQLGDLEDKIIDVLKKLAAPGSVPPLKDNYVAWCRYVHNAAGETNGIRLCDSDSPGAFKVFRHPGVPQAEPPKEEMK